MAVTNPLQNFTSGSEEILYSNYNTSMYDDFMNCSNYPPEYWAELANLSGYEGHPCLHKPFTGPPWWVNIVVQILYGIVCLVGLCGNTLVIYVVVRFSKMQTVTNLYIVNLAIADECFLVGIPFLMTTIMVGSWPFGRFVCKVYFITTSINQITSSFFLLVMSADRYMAVCHPISSPKWRTPLIAKVVALTVWTLSALLMVPIFMYANTLEMHNRVNCNIFWPESGAMSGERIFIYYTFFTAFSTPLALIFIFYVLVIRRLRTVGPKRRPVVAGSSAKDQQQLQQQNNRAKERKKSHKKVTKLVLTVITVYFLCWAPYWVTQMALIYMPPDSTHSEAVLTIYLLCGCLSYSNSAMNPILYAFLSDNFKKSFLKACTCATGKDVNSVLHLENSVFPRGKKHSRRQRKPSAPITSATYAGTTTGIETNTTSIGGTTNGNNKPNIGGTTPGPSGNHLSPLMPHMSTSSSSLSHLNQNRRNTLPEEVDDLIGDSDVEMTSILLNNCNSVGSSNGSFIQFSNKFPNSSGGHCNPFGSNTNIVIPQVLINEPSPLLPEIVSSTDTFVQKNGVHVTSL